MKLEMIPLEKLRPNPFQPRERFSKKKIKELANSIEQLGILEPIIVKQMDGDYEIICGERRWRACKFAGVDSVPAIVKEIAEKRILVDSLSENIHREDLKSTERENAIYELWKTGEFKTKKELAKLLGKHKSRINSIIEAKELREKKSLAAQLSTRAIVDTKGLDDDSRAKVLEKHSKGEIPSSNLRETTRILKSVPTPIREALLKDEIDFEDVKDVINLIPEDDKEAKHWLDEFKARKQAKEFDKEEFKKRAEKAAEKEPETEKVDKTIRARDERILKSIDKKCYDMLFITANTIKSIEDKEMRQMAMDKLEATYLHLGDVLDRLQMEVE